MQLKLKQTINYVQKVDKVVFQGNIRNQFSCECGKSYNAFPALYLHFQRSHKIKISTRLEDQYCSVSKSGNIRTFTYFYSKQKFNRQQNNNEQSVLASVFSEFISAMSNQWDKFPANYLCSKLHKYLVQQKIIQNPTFQMMVVYSLPSYFNQFMLKNEQMMQNKQTYQYNCNILLTLAEWLNLQGYSNIKIQYNTVNVNTSFDNNYCFFGVYEQENRGVQVFNNEMVDTDNNGQFSEFKVKKLKQGSVQIQGQEQAQLDLQSSVKRQGYQQKLRKTNKQISLTPQNMIQKIKTEQINQRQTEQIQQEKSPKRQHMDMREGEGRVERPIRQVKLQI